MSRISWVKGNPALMTVTLMQVNADGTKTAIDLSTYDSWECRVWRLSSYKKVEGDVTAALNASGQVVLSIPATIPCGIYSVEIVCVKNGYDRRSYEVPVFSIVDSNGEAHVTYDEIPCQASADIDMEFQLTPIAETISKNAYEMWKELPGHADKTLQEYIDEVLDLNTITAACVAATEAAEEAASQVGNPDYIGEDNYVYHWNGTAYEKTDIYCKGDTGSQGQTGQTGATGVGISSVTFKETDSSGNNVYTITLTNNNTYDFTAPKGAQGVPGVDGSDGQDGQDGSDGADGVGIDDIEFKETDASGNNVYTITLTDGNSYDFTAPKGAPGAAGASAWSDITGKPTTISGYGITDAKIASGVITLGSDTITPLTSHQDISSKADKVSSATSGNFAALDSNGNLTDSGHKHSDYLTSHQDISNYVQKSNTAGLLKNDGTVDTSTYLTSQLYTSAYCYSGSNERYKKAYCSGFTGFRDAGYIQMIIAQGNGCNADFYISINESGSRRVYIDGVASSSTNYNLQSGSYIVYYDTYNYYFNTDGTIPKVIHTSSTSGLMKNDGTVDTNTYLTSAHEVPAGGNAGQVLAKNSATDYDLKWVNQTQYYPSAYCTTAAGTAAKVASCSLWVATANSYLHVLIGQANTSASALTLNVNSTGAKPVYINGSASSSSNYTLPAGTYLVFYDGTNFHFRTDGKLPGIGGYLESTPTIATSLPVGDLSLNTYYALSTALTGAVTVTLPSVSDTAHVSSIALSFETGSGFTSLTITPPTGVTVSYYDGYAVEASKEYEINLLWNGTKWIVSYAVIE